MFRNTGANAFAKNQMRLAYEDKHDLYCKQLRPAVGDNVTFDRFDSLHKKPVWDKGVIQDMASQPRSYIVSSGGVRYRRNRPHVKPDNTNPMYRDMDEATIVHDPRNNEMVVLDSATPVDVNEDTPNGYGQTNQCS